MSVVLLSVCSGWVHSIDGQHWWRARVEQAALTRNGAVVVCRACWQTVHDLIKVLVSIFGQQRIECSVWELATAPIPRVKPINIGIFMFGISNVESILIFVNSTCLLWSLGEHLSCNISMRHTRENEWNLYHILEYLKSLIIYQFAGLDRPNFKKFCLLDIDQYSMYISLVSLFYSVIFYWRSGLSR